MPQSAHIGSISQLPNKFMDILPYPMNI